MVRMYQALAARHPGFGWTEYLDLFLPTWGGLVGLDRIDASDDPALAEATTQLASKRGPSPQRRG